MQLSPAPVAAKPRMHKIVPTNKDWTLKATYVEVYTFNAYLTPDLQ